MKRMRGVLVAGLVLCVMGVRVVYGSYGVNVFTVAGNCSGDSLVAAGYEAYRAIDGSDVYCWASDSGVGDHWWKYDFTVGVTKTITQYVIKTRDDSNYATQSPKNFTFQGSINNIDWTTLDTQTGISWTQGETKTFNSFSNSTAYRYYRLYITLNQGDTHAYAALNEIQAMVTVAPANLPPTAFSLTTPFDTTSTNNSKPVFSWGTSTDPESQPITYTLKLSTAANFPATGGTITTDGNYTVHTFTSNGTFTSYNSRNVAVLVVGGGGASGGEILGFYDGGGGGGQVTYNSSYAVTGQEYPITVGAGGIAGGTAQEGGTGGSSVFGTITALGGQGGKWSGVGGHNGANTHTGGANFGTGGAGGGAGDSANGGNAVSNSVGGAGGTGTIATIYNGSNIYYGGGGGGGATTTGGSGGLGGGGTNTVGTANTGGGGGGSPGGAYRYAGGSGIVIIRYLSGPPLYRTVPSLTTTSYTAGTEIADGSYYWQVVASDGALETTSTQTWQLTVDTQKPVAPTISTVVCDVTTGKITSITGTGTAETGTTLTFYGKNGGAIAGTVAWTGISNFTFTPSTSLDPGSSVYVKSQDGALNSSQSRTSIIRFEEMKDVFKDIAVYHGTVPGNSMRLEKDTSCEFDIAVNDGSPVTVNAWLKYNSEYDGSLADAPGITLSGPGITTGNTAAMTAPASYTPDTWEELTVSGTPNAKGVVTLKVETFSTADGAAAWVDDISVAQ